MAIAATPEIQALLDKLTMEEIDEERKALNLSEDKYSLKEMELIENLGVRKENGETIFFDKRQGMR